MTIDSKIIEELGHVAVLMGGWSAERPVSLQSGQAVLNALLRQGVQAVGLDVNKDSIINDLGSTKIDRVFIALHGKGGEDGVIQSLLEILEIPYTGSGVAASALAMDKLRTKQLLNGAGLATPNYQVLDSHSNYSDVVSALGLPLIVKPSLEGSSLGMSRVESIEELKVAHTHAKKFAGEILVEQWIEGKEYTVAILGENALPVIQLKTSHDFYDYSAKYQSNDTEYLCPCGLSKEDESSLQELALSAFKKVGAVGWGRVDFMCDAANKPWVIEINTIPGMTDHSLVPMAAKQFGLSFDELVVSILQQTTEGDRNGSIDLDAKGNLNV